jgi:hypothetical protein
VPEYSFVLRNRESLTDIGSHRHSEWF